MGKMKNLIWIVLLALAMIGCEDKPVVQEPAASPPAASAHDDASAVDVPVKGLVTLVDLGADRCVPCKMMAPILVELKKEYQGRAAIVFLDVWKDKAPAVRFSIRAIPTQIFFDKNGTEVYRHVGFMSKEAIVAQLDGMGVE